MGVVSKRQDTHEVASHGTDSFIKSLYKAAPPFDPYNQFNKDLFFEIRGLSPKEALSFTMPELRATVNEFRAKFPKWRNMTFDEFINNIDEYKNINNYAYNHAKILKSRPDGYRQLYYLIQHPRVY